MPNLPLGVWYSSAGLPLHRQVRDISASGAFILTEDPVSLDAVVREVATEEAGAIATFSGTARRHSRGRVVSYLDYEGYEGMAEEMMANSMSPALTSWSSCGSCPSCAPGY